MKTSSDRFSHAVAVLFSAVLLSSCSGAGAISSSSSALRPTSLAVVPPKAMHSDRRKNWELPDAKGGPLAFVSDSGAGKMDIFSLPDFKRKGALTELTGGECSDGVNVWVVNGIEAALELSPRGKVVATIKDAYGNSCAVDPKTGDLAVLSVSGGIYLYSCTKCKPKVLTIPYFDFYYFGGYDSAGDIFVDGLDKTSGKFVLGEVPAGDTTGYIIPIGGSSTIYFPGFVEWYESGSYLAVGDQLCGDTTAACVYHVQISGSKGTIIGKTTLLLSSGGQVCDMVQGALDPIHGKYLVGGDYEYCGRTGSSVNRWLYPAGGMPTNSYTKGISEPTAVAIGGK